MERRGHPERQAFEELERRRLLSRAVTAALEAQGIGVQTLPAVRFTNYKASGHLTRPVSDAPESIARAYIRSQRSKLGVVLDDLAELAVTNQYTDLDSDITHVYFVQRYKGVDVAGARFSVHVRSDGRVLTAGGSLVDDLAKKANRARENAIRGGVSADSLPAALTKIPAHKAVESASRRLGLRTSAPVSYTMTSGRKAPGRHATLAAAGVSLDEVPAGLQYVPVSDGELRLAWQLSIRTPDQNHWYQVSVDGYDGRVLGINDWAGYFTSSYNVFPAPLENPLDGPRLVVVDPHDPASSPFGWHDNNGVAGSDFTDTRGNNVLAQEDADANNSGGSRPSATVGAGGELTFDYPFDPAQSPSANRDAAITNLFYWTNLLHDVHASYGFTEIAGNFQTLNYSGQGVGSDPVIADVQDGSSLNSSSFMTPPEGTAPRMQMFIFNKTTPNRDGAFDNGVVIHEYGHGVSTRLTGGAANSNSLAALQSASMGEGWSDWWSLMFTLKASDSKMARYPLGTYLEGQDPVTGVGMRSLPYSFDKLVNPLIYTNIRNKTDPHEVGEVWCSALWDMTWLLIDKHGFDADWQHGYSPADPARNGGNNLALKLVMEALKLQPANPSFLAGRDAILAADVALTGGANALEIWTAFARRGMGFSARDDGGANATNVFQGTDLPPTIRTQRVASQSPAQGSVSLQTISQLDITFSEPMDPASFSVADDVTSFTTPLGGNLKSQVSSIAWFNSNTTLRLRFATQSIDGLYRLVLAPTILTADDHAPLDQDQDRTVGEATEDSYAATFRYDSLVLAVTSTSPPNSTVVTLPLSTLDLNFNEPIDPASFQTTDISLSRGAVSSVAALDGDTARFTLSISGEGDLTYSLAAGRILDAVGNPNSAFSGKLTLENGFISYPGSFSLVRPNGSETFSSSATTTLSPVGDVDGFRIPIKAGTPMRLIFTGAAGVQARLDVLDTQDQVMASGTVGTTLPLVNIPLTGTYTLRMTSLGGSTGTVRVAVDLGAIHEAESTGGPSSNAANPQNIETAFRSVAPGLDAQRVMIRGATIGGTDTQDAYSFNLAAGQSVTISTAETYSSGQLTLRASDGRIMATSAVSPSGLGWLISDFVATTAETYRAQFDYTSSSRSYGLMVMRGASIEAEPNETASTANTMASSRLMVGEANDTDFLEVFVKAGDVLRLETHTPNGENIAASPSNLLDPRLVLLDSNQVSLATNDNSAADGKNALITYTATADAKLYVQVQGASSNTGSYVLEVQGATGAPPATVASVISPTNTTRLSKAPGTIRVSFSEPIVPSSVSADDFLIDGVPASGLSIVNHREVTITNPSTNLAEGNHLITMAAGAIVNLRGGAVAAMSSGFVIDKTGPRIISSSIQENTVVPTFSAAVFQIQFDEPVDMGYFGSDDFLLTNTTGGIPNETATWTYEPAANTLTIRYPQPNDGAYTFTLFGRTGGLTDLAGNPLDGEVMGWPIPNNHTGDGLAGGDFVINLVVDSASVAFPPLLPLKPLVSQMYSANTWLNLHSGTDSDTFTLNLVAGQMLSVSVYPSSGLIKPTVEVRSPSGAILRSGSGPYNQSGVFFNSIPVTVSGIYSIRGLANGSTGLSDLTVTINGSNEGESQWGGTNNFEPQAAEAVGFISLSLPGRLMASVRGELTDYDVDYFKLDLVAGDTVSVLAEGDGEDTAGALEILAMNGTNAATIATGIKSGKTLWVPSVTAPLSGTYVARITNVIRNTSVYDDPYTITIVKNAGTEQEPYNNVDPVRLESKVISGAQAQLGYVESAGDHDRYSIPVAAGQSITVVTQTPDGLGLLNNALDPKLTLYDDTGAVLAADDNSAGDARNARIVYTHPVNALLYLDVSGAAIDNQGMYLLSVSGSSAAPSSTPFLAEIPYDGIRMKEVPHGHLYVPFNRDVNVASVQPSDLTVDGMPAIGVQMVGGDLVGFQMPNLSEGEHTASIAAGSILDLLGTPVQAASSTFSLDLTPPRVINSSIQRNGIASGAPLVANITFDDPMQTSIVDASGLRLRGMLRNVEYNPEKIEFNAAGTMLSLTYSSVPEDQYRLSLFSDGSAPFQNLAHAQLDGETTAATWPIGPNRSGNGAEGGTFAVDFFVDAPDPGVPLPALVPIGPSGAFIQRTSVAGMLHEPADVDRYAIDLEAGQRLTAHLSGAFRSSITVRDPQGASLGTFRAVSTNNPAVAQGVPAAQAGTYVIEVASDSASQSGLYTLEVDLNAVRELEPVTNTPNNAIASAQPLTLSSDRAAVHGNLESGTLADYYSVTMGAGERLSALAALAFNAGAVITILDGNGATLATAPVSSSIASIPAYRAVAGGTYYIRLTATSAVTYSLHLLRNALLEVEPNNQATQAHNISAMPRVFGSVVGGSSFTSHVGEGFEAGFLGQAWTTSSTKSGRIQLSAAMGAATGALALLMDDGADDSVYALNEATLTVDLSTKPGATLSFAHASFGDEATPSGAFSGHANADGVFISDDGFRWYPVWTPTGTETSEWKFYSIDLAAKTAEAGMRLGGNFKIRFQQYDERSLSGGDGRGWDAVLISTPLPEAEHLAIDLGVGQVITLRTITPGAGSQPANLLDPRIEVLAPGIVLLGSDDNSANDGRNAELTFTTTEAGRYIVKLTSANGAFGDYGLFVTDATPPRVLSALYRGPVATPPAAVDYVTIAFSESVQASLTLDDIAVKNVATEETIAPLSLDYDTATNTAVVALPALTDGNYRLTVNAAGVSDWMSHSLDGNGDGNPVDDFVLSFFKLAGDINGDREVSFVDLLVVAANFGKSPATPPEGDTNFDGSVSFVDLLTVAAKFGTKLPSPAQPLAASAVSGKSSTQRPVFTSRSRIGAVSKPVRPRTRV